jgi:hypothetical protein
MHAGHAMNNIKYLTCCRLERLTRIPTATLPDHSVSMQLLKTVHIESHKTMAETLDNPPLNPPYRGQKGGIGPKVIR